MADRNEARQRFIAACGWADAAIEPLRADASFRRYYRLRRGAESRMLMDAPPEKGEDVRPFAKIDRYLIDLGLSAPRIHAEDAEQGFLLLEDFGDSTFTRLLDGGHDEFALYELGTDALIQLHRLARTAGLGLAAYGPAEMIEAATLLLDWYYPEATGAPADDACRQAYAEAWKDIFAGLGQARETLVLRDYHVDNLMLLPSRDGAAACGLLDFQDARIGHEAYDLVSLLEDARRDIPDELTQAMLARYAQAIPVDESFMDWYRVMGVQRHARVMGVFVRLSKRDGKHHYRSHLPRVERLFAHGLSYPVLKPLRSWRDAWMPKSR